MWTPDPTIIVTADQKAEAARAELTRQIDAEHDRRVFHGKAFDLGGVVVSPDGSAKTQLVIMALDRNAQQARAAGVTAPIFPFTDRDNVDHLLTPDQVIQLMSDGSAWVQAMHNAKRDLKLADPIPGDFTDDARWP